MFWSPRLPFTKLVSTKTSGCAYCAMQRSSGGSEVIRCYITCAKDYSDTHLTIQWNTPIGMDSRRQQQDGESMQFIFQAKCQSPHDCRRFTETTRANRL